MIDPDNGVFDETKARIEDANQSLDDVVFENPFVNNELSVPSTVEPIVNNSPVLIPLNQ